MRAIFLGLVAAIGLSFTSVPTVAEPVGQVQVQAQLKNDLQVLSSMRGPHSSLLSQSVFRAHANFDGRDYLAFFSARVKTIGSSVPDSAMGAYFKGGQLNLTPKYLKDSQLSRLSILIHESSHATLPGHRNCPVPFNHSNGQPIRGHWGLPLAGRPACDFYLGSYAAQIIFLRNVAQNCATCSPATRAEARSLADDYLLRIINPTVTAQILRDR